MFICRYAIYFHEKPFKVPYYANKVAGKIIFWMYPKGCQKKNEQKCLHSLLIFLYSVRNCSSCNKSRSELETKHVYCSLFIDCLVYRILKCPLNGLFGTKISLVRSTRERGRRLRTPTRACRPTTRWTARASRWSAPPSPHTSPRNQKSTGK